MDHLDATIEMFREQLREQEEQARKTKRTINAICEQAGRPLLYPDADEDGPSGLDQIQADTFYGQRLNTSAKRVLEMRKAAGLGPAHVREIYDALVRGGYQFNAKTEKNAMDSLRISLGKSSHTFHKLPNGQYGLLEWYPNVKQREANSKKITIEDAAESDAASDEEVGATPTPTG